MMLMMMMMMMISWIFRNKIATKANSKIFKWTNLKKKLQQAAMCHPLVSSHICQKSNNHVLGGWIPTWLVMWIHRSPIWLPRPTPSAKSDSPSGESRQAVLWAAGATEIGWKLIQVHWFHLDPQQKKSMHQTGFGALKPLGFAPCALILFWDFKNKVNA